MDTDIGQLPKPAGRDVVQHDVRIVELGSVLDEHVGQRAELNDGAVRADLCGRTCARRRHTAGDAVALTDLLRAAGAPVPQIDVCVTVVGKAVVQPPCVRGEGDEPAVVADRRLVGHGLKPAE